MVWRVPDTCCACQVLALARKMLDGRSKQDILDSSYHRYAFHDTGVPKWFYEDEKRHMRCASSTPCKPLEYLDQHLFANMISVQTFKQVEIGLNVRLAELCWLEHLL